MFKDTVFATTQDYHLKMSVANCYDQHRRVRADTAGATKGSGNNNVTMRQQERFDAMKAIHKRHGNCICYSAGRRVERDTWKSTSPFPHLHRRPWWEVRSRMHMKLRVETTFIGGQVSGDAFLPPTYPCLSACLSSLVSLVSLISLISRLSVSP